MKHLRISLAAALLLAGLGLTSILHSETRRLTAQENVAVGACASRYYVCNGQCQKFPTGEARASCEAECLRTYNACFEASVRPAPVTNVPVAPSLSPVARPTATAMPRNISPPKPVATIAPRGVVPKQAMVSQTPTPAPRNFSSQRGGGPVTTVAPAPRMTTVPPSVVRRGASQPAVASPTPTPIPPNFSRRPIGGTLHAKPTPTISPQAVPRVPAAATATAPAPSPTPVASPHRSKSHRKHHRRHRSEEASPTPTPTSQPTPQT